MNKRYKFKYKKSYSPFWISKEVIGHGIEFVNDSIYDEKGNLLQQIKKPLNSMVLYFEDGSIFKIAKWDTYDLYLGLDWVLATKSSLENQAGQGIPFAL